jgi:dihydroflavonol-4-reductase
VRVLVTGGSGFVGSRLAAALVGRGDAVRVLHRVNSSLAALQGLPVEHVVGDILDPAAVARATVSCDLVFHVAAISSYWRARRQQIYQVNVDGTRTVMEACLRARVGRVVHTSSVAAVGLVPDGTTANEQTSFDPASAAWPYADSKHLAETEVYRATDRGLQAVIVNPAVVIGAGDHYLVSSSMVLELARHRIPAVPPGGVCVADVDAVVQGHIAAAKRGRVGERYILGGENLSYRQVAAIITSVAGRPAPRRTIPRWLLPPAAVAVETYNRIGQRPPIVSGQQIRFSALNLFFDSSKAVRELSYPLLPFQGAAEKAYGWYREHGYLA